MTTYDDLGIPRIINAAATLTRLGGSRMPPPVVEAMVAASGAFVDLATLQERVGAGIANLTHNAACYVSSGAAAGLTLAVAACITGTDPAAIARFPRLENGKHEVIVHRCQRNGYDYAIRQLGVHLIEIGSAQGTIGGRAGSGDHAAHRLCGLFCRSALHRGSSRPGAGDRHRPRT